MFQLTEEESGVMVSQNVTPFKQHLGSYFPSDFTELEVLELSNLDNPIF
jgi:hypothetical protein